MKATCYDVKCTFQIDNVCSKFPSSHICAVSGLNIIPDKITTKVDTKDEFELFKEFIHRLRKEINYDDSKIGLCKNNTNFAMVYKMIQQLDNLTTALTSDDTKEIKKELFKICTIAYKMWRKL